jgi:hypothetical protein
MADKDILSEMMAAHYGTVQLLRRSESDDEVLFDTSAPLLDPQLVTFRSASTLLNALAIAHRLSLALARDRYAIGQGSRFAIKSIGSKNSKLSDGPAGRCRNSLRFDVVSRRHNSITELLVTLSSQHATGGTETSIVFGVMPPSLVKFVRQSRAFMDYLESSIDVEKPTLRTISDNRLEYTPSESDRISDGERVDHVPALVLIDLAIMILGTDHLPGDDTSLTAEFSNYTDPRIPIDIVRSRPSGAVEFRQRDQVTAYVIAASALP